MCCLLHFLKTEMKQRLLRCLCRGPRNSENTGQICSPVHLRPAAMAVPASDAHMTTCWLNKPGQDDSPQQQSSVTGYPYYQVSTVPGPRAAGEPSSLSLGHHAPGLWPFPQGSQWDLWPPMVAPTRGILLGFGTRHLSCLVRIRLPEPRLLPQPRAVRLDKNNLEEGGKNNQRRLGSSRSCSGSRA